MRAFKVESRVGADGVLRLELPVEEKDSDLELVIVVQPAGRKGAWPDRFFEDTYGAFEAYPLERSPQGESERRLPLR